MERRGEGAPRAQDSPQLSALQGEFASSDPSFSALPFLFCHSSCLTVPNLRKEGDALQLL